jgi:hypothetical protein
VKLWLSDHPAGAAGIALLLLRVAGALTLFVACLWLSADLPNWLTAGFAIVAALLFLGLGTRVVALIGALVVVGICIRIDGRQGTIIGLEVLDFAAIALLGPGAYSIDSLLFGRRVIRLDTRGDDPNG